MSTTTVLDTSSTDGIHDRVSFVHFPVMGFPVYGEMGRLLNLYYS